MFDWKDDEIERLKTEIRQDERQMQEARTEIKRLRRVVVQLQNEETEIFRAINQSKMLGETEVERSFNEALEIAKGHICKITQISEEDFLKGEEK